MHPFSWRRLQSDFRHHFSVSMFARLPLPLSHQAPSMHEMHRFEDLEFQTCFHHHYCNMFIMCDSREQVRFQDPVHSKSGACDCVNSFFRRLRASVLSLPQVNASVQPVVCVGYDSITVKHVSNSGAIVRPTITTYMHIVSTKVLVTIMNCSQSKQQIRIQLMRSPANGIPSPPSLRTRIKPQQPHHLMMSRTCLDARRHSAWMKRS